jgi:hypothetical protein
MLMREPGSIDETKRKLRKLKRLEMKIRFGGQGNAVNLDAGSIMKSNRIRLVWDEFFSIGGNDRARAKYNLEDVAAMSREEYKNVLDEFFFNVYYRYYTENGITASRLYDPDVLGWMGLAPDASAADVKRRFRELAKKYHPDAGMHIVPGLLHPLLLWRVFRVVPFIFFGPQCIGEVDVGLYVQGYLLDHFIHIICIRDMLKGGSGFRCFRAARIEPDGTAVPEFVYESHIYIRAADSRIIQYVDVSSYDA